MGRSDKGFWTMDWLRHAFAIEDPGVVELAESERELIDRVCAEVVRRRLTTPALLMLEINRPLNYVSAQALHFFEPIVSVLTDTEGYRGFARFLEHRGSIDHLVARIEVMDSALGGGEKKVVIPSESSGADD